MGVFLCEKHCIKSSILTIYILYMHRILTLCKKSLCGRKTSCETIKDEKN